MGDDLPYLVAEVSRRWGPNGDSLGARFQRLVNDYAARGYVLHDWRLATVVQDGADVTETVVAVFRRKDLSPEGLPWEDMP